MGQPYNDNRSPAAARAVIPGSVWALGFVSLFMDVSSEMVHALLPVFLVTVLGASSVIVGAIEGIGEAAASMSKLLSGWLSDRLGRRKTLTVLGYGLSALSKPLFALAPTPSWVLVARFSDRIGKGVRGAPRDALLSELAPPALRGAAFGLRQALDTAGAFAGPLLAIVLMASFAGQFRLVFALAIVPALIAVVVLIAGVREPDRPAADRTGFVIRWKALGALGTPFWRVVAVGIVLTLARFSEAFLILRAERAGLTITWIPLVLVVMNAVYAAAAYPMGALSDRTRRRPLLAAGFAVLIVADVVLALAPTVWLVLLGVGLWGLHMAMTQGLLATLVADTAPPALRGTAFGLFHLLTGASLLAASLIAGLLWDRLGPPATFLGGALLAAIGLAALVLSARNRSR